jgi:hypothetical protein
MTLGEFFTMLTAHPEVLVAFYLVVPLTAALAGFLGQGQGHRSPWRWLYAALVYMTAVPGMFALVLSIYIWLFERGSILDTDLLLQVLPLLSMILTFWLVRRNTPLRGVPGFGRLSGLLMMIFVVLTLMWVADKTRIIAFTFFPLVSVILILAGLLMVFRLGWARWLGDR